MYCNIINVLVTLFLVKSVSCLICLKCDEAFQPRPCHYVTTCANDEVCGADRIMTKFGNPAFKLGCVKNKTCSSSGSNSTYCHECCNNKDLCNAGACGQPGYPTGLGPVCYNCEDYNQPSQCHKIAHCSSDQICSITRQTEFGDVIMTSSCQPRYGCLHRGSPSIVGKRSEIVDRDLQDIRCHNCCSQDFCNSDCALDPCQPSPCQRGQCSVIGTGFTCLCPPGWIGQTCDILEDACASSPCSNGICQYKHSQQDYECVCNKGWTGQFCDQRKTLGFDCLDILTNGLGSTDGIYDIQLNGTNTTIKVYCDMTTDGGGWTVFQRRFNGSVDFYRNFSEYENGFGSLEGEFWLGLMYVYNMTHDIRSELRLDLENSTGGKIYELDRGFRLRDPPYYGLLIDGYWISEGYKKYGTNTGLGYYNGHPFSTFDKDHSGYDCPVKSHGAFWYSSCSDVNPNGEYVTPGTVWRKGGQFNPGYGGIIYHQWMGFKSLKSTKMMFRRS